MHKLTVVLRGKACPSFSELLMFGILVHIHICNRTAHA
jgi:hypothetical protein